MAVTAVGGDCGLSDDDVIMLRLSTPIRRVRDNRQLLLFLIIFIVFVQLARTGPTVIVVLLGGCATII